MTDDEADMYYDRWLVAKNRIKQLESGVMDMKQTIANMETKIEELEKNLDLVYQYNSNLIDHLKGWK
jgi:phage shock protein A